MVKIKEITLNKKFSLGNYEMLDIGLIATTEEGDEQTIREVVKELYAEIQKLGQEAKDKLL